MAQLHLDPDELRSLVQETVAHVVHELDEFKVIYNGRLGYSEAEAADLLGLKQHQLRDLRRNGKISYARIVGNRVCYTIEDLRTYLRTNREGRTRQEQQ